MFVRVRLEPAGSRPFECLTHSPGPVHGLRLNLPALLAALGWSGPWRGRWRVLRGRTRAGLPVVRNVWEVEPRWHVEEAPCRRGEAAAAA